MLNLPYDRGVPDTGLETPRRNLNDELWTPSRSGWNGDLGAERRYTFQAAAAQTSHWPQRV